MKNILHVKHIFILILLISLVCFQTVFSDFVICLGEDGHVDLDMSLSKDKLATNHHMKEYCEKHSIKGDDVVITEKHDHGCYDILILFCSEFAKIKAKIVPGTVSDYSHFAAYFVPSIDSVFQAVETTFAVTHAPPGVSPYLSCNISLLI